MSGLCKQLSRNRVPAILQDGARQHHLIVKDGCLFIVFPEGETLERFPTLLLVRHFGFPLALKRLLLGTPSLWPHCLSTTGRDLHLNLVCPVYALPAPKPLLRMDCSLI